MENLDRLREKIDKADELIARGYSDRMNAVRQIGEYKSARGLPVYDKPREDAVIDRSLSLVNDEKLKPGFERVMRTLMCESRKYQSKIINTPDKINVTYTDGSYDVIIRRGCINDAGLYLGRYGKVLVVTDDGVPVEYSKAVASQCKEAYAFTVRQGEQSKNIENFGNILAFMLEKHFDRRDCVVAVGGGVAGDLAGFVASSYMRGVDFYNVPTTLLSQVDSSVGGKTAINIGNVKNSAGAFYRPSAVFIDPDTLITLPQRQINNGMAEVIKTAFIGDTELYELIKDGNISENIEKIIFRCVDFKRSVVEADEKEQNLRRILNFGHTIGHGIEAASGGKLLHGECVAVGMIPMCDGDVKDKLISVLAANGLPVKAGVNTGDVIEFMSHDKKKTSEMYKIIRCGSVGSCYEAEITEEEIRNLAGKEIL